MGDDICVVDVELILAAVVLFVSPPKSVFPSGYLDPVHTSKFGVDHEPQCQKNVAFVGRGLWWEHVPKCCFASFEQACILNKPSPEPSKSFQLLISDIWDKTWSAESQPQERKIIVSSITPETLLFHDDNVQDSKRIGLHFVLLSVVIDSRKWRKVREIH